jgi:hypothetical protein
MITTNDVLARLRNGESMDTIGQSIADVLNEAQEAYKAEQEVAKKAQADAKLAQAKRLLAEELIDLIQEYGDLVAPEAANMLDEVDDDDIDAMVEALDQMFQMMTAMVQLKANLESLDKLPVPKAQVKSKITPAGKLTNSDDEVLAKFIASLM